MSPVDRGGDPNVELEVIPSDALTLADSVSLTKDTAIPDIVITHDVPVTQTLRTETIIPTLSADLSTPSLSVRRV